MLRPILLLKQGRLVYKKLQYYLFNFKRVYNKNNICFQSSKKYLKFLYYNKNREKETFVLCKSKQRVACRLGTIFTTCRCRYCTYLSFLFHVLFIYRSMFFGLQASVNIVSISSHLNHNSLSCSMVLPFWSRYAL